MSLSGGSRKMNVLLVDSRNSGSLWALKEVLQAHHYNVLHSTMEKQFVNESVKWYYYLTDKDVQTMELIVSAGSAARYARKVNATIRRTIVFTEPPAGPLLENEHVIETLVPVYKPVSNRGYITLCGVPDDAAREFPVESFIKLGGASELPNVIAAAADSNYFPFTKVIICKEPTPEMLASGIPVLEKDDWKEDIRAMLQDGTSYAQASSAAQQRALGMQRRTLQWLREKADQAPVVVIQPQNAPQQQPSELQQMRMVPPQAAPAGLRFGLRRRR